MKQIEFTGEYLDGFFEDHFIEDEELYDFLKGRSGIIEESKESFETAEEHIVLNIKLMMGE